MSSTVYGLGNASCGYFPRSGDQHCVGLSFCCSFQFHGQLNDTHGSNIACCREPAKFVAKLREYKTDKNILCFKCEMGAGHFSQSGRFDRLKDTALEWAFLLKTQSLLGRELA